jgi:hypothetical protein
LQGWKYASRKYRHFDSRQDRPQQRWPQRKARQDFPDHSGLTNALTQVAKGLHHEQNNDQLDENLTGEHSGLLIKSNCFTIL